MSVRILINDNQQHFYIALSRFEFLSINLKKQPLEFMTHSSGW